MEKHRCKLCFRRFSNGRALGGHMRSHVAPAPARPPPPPAVAATEAPQHALPSLSASSSFSAAAGPELEVEKSAPPTYVLRENPRKSIRLADPEFSASFAAAAGSSSVVQDGESDAESSLRRRPKRRQGAASTSELVGGDGEPLSSVSDASPEEEVARCLVLLSRDAWSRFGAEEQRHSNEEYEELDEEEDDGDEEERVAAARLRRRRTRYQCGNCRKVFRSYQALGGHRASHKRVGMDCVPTSGLQIHGDEFHGNAGDHEAKIFECPYCYRVFSSGQALGGHKRSHFSSSSSAAAAVIATPTIAPALLPPPRSDSYAATINKSSIDLNLPAPLEEEAELSAVSVAIEFRSQ